MKPDNSQIQPLLEIVKRLRGPEGCPWDRRQTDRTFKKYVLEEAHELLAAIDQGIPALICEELGDLLFQIIFLVDLYEEQGTFTLDDVVKGICRKMVRRHPHVFGDSTIKDVADLKRQWQEIKAGEKGGQNGTHHLLESIPRSLPAMRRCQRLAERASRTGFDWETWEEALSKVEEEFQELKEAVGAGDKPAQFHELGDLLFALASLARKLEMDAEEAAGASADRFIERFRKLEQALAGDGRRLDQLSREELLKAWRTAKLASPGG